MAANDNVAGVDNTFRRKFDREEYLERAREREKQESDSRAKSKSKGPPVQRKPLKHRDYVVDLESRLGKTQVVTPIAPLSQQAGYYCSVCECVVKDSANYLDHINGKKHQRALGMSMRVERASLDQVHLQRSVSALKCSRSGKTLAASQSKILMRESASSRKRRRKGNVNVEKERKRRRKRRRWKRKLKLILTLQL
ncbi:zinc finger matrin-type protein 2 isoform X2 [Mangifera indica]|uniref:zinc finger matrin-type protein 2 isoform X2 n=1 Tax=Mangifera indica TaxID=29780 RepID=UPI001CFBCDBC|nr:zinc finger matrin-type protein 2 isoform X2 [Mangifera indica]